MLRIHPKTALGQTLAFDVCTLPNTVKNLPGVKDLVNRFGCTDAGKAQIVAGLSKLSLPSAVQAVGAEVIVDCLCAGVKPGPGVTPKPWWQSPWVLGGAALLVIGSGVLLGTRHHGGAAKEFGWL